MADEPTTVDTTTTEKLPDTTTATIAGGAGGDTTKAVETVVDTTKAADTTAATEKSWRDDLAGEDKDFRKRLERFTAPNDFAKSYRALETKLSSGEYKRALPADAKPEEIATWRKENGVPDKADEYVAKLALPNGVVLGEEDKPVVSAFAEMAQGKNWTPAQYNDAVSWYYETQNKLAGKRQEQDQNFMAQTEDKLRTDWGNDYRRNLNIVGSIRDSMPEGLRDRFMAGRTADGKIFGNDPDVLAWLVSLGRELHPAATLLPVGTSDPVKGVADRISEIRKFNRDNPDAYNADKAMQKEYLELLNADSKLKSRVA